MIRGIDHLVIACPDPDEAAATLESELGIAVTGGGRHPGAGSWNRIAWLADASYLELIGIDDPGLASKSPVSAAALRALESRRRARDLLAARRRDRPHRAGPPGCRSHLRLAERTEAGPATTARSSSGGSPSPIGRSPSTAFRSSSSTRTSERSGDRRPWPSAPASSIRSDLRSACTASTSRRPSPTSMASDAARRASARLLGPRGARRRQRSAHTSCASFRAATSASRSRSTSAPRSRRRGPSMCSACASSSSRPTSTR